MLKRDKTASDPTPKCEGAETSDAQRDVARPKGDTRAWGAVKQLPGGNKKFDARRKVPSGPLGGSGRKTNLSRSS